MRSLIAVLILALSCSSASAQVACSNYEVIRKNMSEKYGEALVAKGKIDGEGEGSNKAYFELFASEKGTFTLLFRRAGSKIACFMATGDEISILHFGTSL